MQQYTYAQIETAEPYPGEDGSRVISFFVFNTDVHFHVYCGDGRERSEEKVPGVPSRHSMTPCGICEENHRGSP